MFSKKMLMIVGAVVLIAVNIIILSVTSRRYPSYGLGRTVITIVAPFQEIVTDSVLIFRQSMLPALRAAVAQLG